VLPTKPVAEVDVAAAVALAKRLLEANKDRRIRITTGDSRPGKTAWVYGRVGKPCLRCGTRIEKSQLGPGPLQLRDVYWCPYCQR
jgi:endonuclease-8